MRRTPTARVEKAVVVGDRDTARMTPAAIDAYVRAQVAAGKDLYTLHADALAALQPELILTQDLCRVCALPAGQVEQAGPRRRWREAAVPGAHLVRVGGVSRARHTWKSTTTLEGEQ